MKEAVLLVSFGTSHQDARQNSLEEIYRELTEIKKGMPVYQAYTSGMIIKKLSEEGIHIPTVDEAVRQALEQQADCLYVVPTHMIPGSEYHKIVRTLETYRPNVTKLLIADPVLAKESDCDRVVSILHELLDFRPGYEYILMGHGTEAAANVRYAQMNEAFVRAGFSNVRIASVEAKPDLEDALQAMRRRKSGTQVIVHPFMVVAGDHAKNDMAGDEDSYVSRLKAEGYQPRALIKGLGEYPQFRRIYVDRLTALMK